MRLIQAQDTTPEEAISAFQQVNGDAATLSPNLRYQVVKSALSYFFQPCTICSQPHSIWKPLRGPLRDWPLALCDAETVQADHLVAADKVFEARFSENLQVYYDAAQSWFYLKDQEPSELLVFRQADSHPTGRVGMLAQSCSSPMMDGSR